MPRQFIRILLKRLEDLVPRSFFLLNILYSDCELLDPQSLVPVPETKPNNPIQSAASSNAGASNTSTTGTVRQMFKFTPEQKQIMTEKFNAGLHYPTNAEKEALSEMFGASSESVISYLAPGTDLLDFAMVRTHTQRKGGSKNTKTSRDSNNKTTRNAPIFAYST
jgi:hypothetical protein